MATLISQNPSNLDDVVLELPAASVDEIVDAAKRAKAAQKSWAAMPAPARGRVIANVGRLVEANHHVLAKLITREMGKVYAEALGEVQEVIDTCDFFLGEGRRLYGQTVPSEMPNKNLFTFRMPVGSALIITAGNFPAAVPSWYIVPALLTGNSVLWKPAEYTPAVANALTSLFHAGGVPRDVLITLVADGATTFDAMDKCLAQGLINKVGYQFLARYADTVSKAIIGDPMKDVLYGPMISKKYLANHESHLQMIQKHHTVLGSTGTGRITKTNPRHGFIGDPDAGVFAHPTIVAGINANDELYSTETFGPLVTVGKFKTIEEAIELSNGHGYGLSSAIYSSDPKTIWKYREGVSSGMISVNNSTSGAEAHLPFGGNGKSGNGSRQSGVWVLDQFTRWQSLNWDWSGKLQKAQMDIVEVKHDPHFRIEG